MGASMNIEMLQYFQYIAKYKNITKAAKHFYISQSTLSRHIMALENEIGVKLFERNNKQVELTGAGEVFYNDCDSFVKHMETIIKNVQAANQGTSGILRITSPSSLSHILTNTLHVMQDEHPFIRLVVEAYDFNEIPSAIKYDLYNIGLTYDFASLNHEELKSIPVGTDDFSMVVSSRLFNNPTKETIAQIVKSLPLILPSHTEPPFMKLLLHHFQNYAAIKSINTIFLNTTESVMLEASLGLGFGIVPTTWKNSYSHTKNISFIKLDEFPTNCNIVMLYKKENPPELVHHFADIATSLYEKKQASDLTEHST